MLSFLRHRVVRSRATQRCLDSGRAKLNSTDCFVFPHSSPETVLRGPAEVRLTVPRGQHDLKPSEMPNIDERGAAAISPHVCVMFLLSLTDLKTLSLLPPPPLPPPVAGG